MQQPTTIATADRFRVLCLVLRYRRRVTIQLARTVLGRLLLRRAFEYWNYVFPTFATDSSDDEVADSSSDDDEPPRRVGQEGRRWTW